MKKGEQQEHSGDRGREYRLHGIPLFLRFPVRCGKRDPGFCPLKSLPGVNIRRKGRERGPPPSVSRSSAGLRRRTLPRLPFHAAAPHRPAAAPSTLPATEMFPPKGRFRKPPPLPLQNICICNIVAAREGPHGAHCGSASKAWIPRHAPPGRDLPPPV